MAAVRKELPFAEGAANRPNRPEAAVDQTTRERRDPNKALAKGQMTC
jgi:hypothetical protein